MDEVYPWLDKAVTMDGICLEERSRTYLSACQSHTHLQVISKFDIPQKGNNKEEYLNFKYQEDIVYYCICFGFPMSPFSINRNMIYSIYCVIQI